MIASLDDAWHWYESTRKLIQTMRRMGEKHWNDLPWGGDLGRDERLKQVKAEDILEESRIVIDELDDLCVLLLFSAFEAIVRERVWDDIQSELPTFRHSALIHAVESLNESIASGSFHNNVLEPLKRMDANLVEEVNQVRHYRNWVAHGRRGEQPASVNPKNALDRLKRFLELLKQSAVNSDGN